MARVAALTGGTGFIGRAVAGRLVAEGWQLRLLARRPPSHPQLGGLRAEIVIGDLGDQNSLERLVASADAVIHCAGVIKAPSAKAFFQTNVAGSARLGEVVSRVAPSARLVVVSSLAAREPALSSYAYSKRAGEDAILAAARSSSWVVVRPTVVYGPWDREVLRLFRTVSRGIAPMLNGPAARLSVVHVDDVAAAIAALSRAGAAGQVHELDDGKSGGYSWRDLLGSVATALGRNPAFIRIPAPFLRAAAAAVGGAVQLCGGSTLVSPGKAREVLHPDWACVPELRPPAQLWQPRIPASDGFAATASWYRSMKWL